MSISEKFIEVIEMQRKDFASGTGKVSLISASKACDLKNVRMLIEESDYDISKCNLALQSAAIVGCEEIVMFFDVWDESGRLRWESVIPGLIVNDRRDLLNYILTKRSSQINVEQLLPRMQWVAENSKNFEMLAELLALAGKISSAKYFKSLAKEQYGYEPFTESWH